jgi:hypothetical protein
MVIPIPCNKSRFNIRVGIRSSEPIALGVRCYDPSKPNTDYIRRKVPFQEAAFSNRKSVYREFTLPFPLSPDMLAVELFDKNTGYDDAFTIEKFKVEKSEPAEVWAEPDMHRFVEFAQNFAEKAGYISPGAYDDEDGEFLIQYMPVITDMYGEPLVTPARTNRKSGRIQVAQSEFVGYTIPVRLVVLFHERYHFEIPTRLEKPADLHGIRLYLDLGFPRTEAVYATTKIFLNHPDTVGAVHRNRVRDVIRFINDYSYRKGKKMHEAA